MNTRSNSRLLRASIVYLILAIGCSEPTENQKEIELSQEEQFVFEVLPLLQSKCFSCHGDDPEKIEGEFDIRSLHGMLKGGESEKAALIPGKPDQSPIYIASSWEDEEFQMPPKENDRLKEDELQQLKTWIEAGAIWPDDSTIEAIYAQASDEIKGNTRVQVKTSKALQTHWEKRRYKKEDLWAYYPLKKVIPPEEDMHPIDAFIRNRLAKNDLKPAKKASKRELARRAHFDLLGLPPSPESLENFIENDHSDSWAKLIEELLSSRHYGEQWARHWLDVVRYADTDGLSNDYARPNAWRYRDYVIRSFNQDKSYKDFTIEQIAGDEIDPRNSEYLIATAYLRMGPWEHTGMSVAAETRQLFLDDVTNSVGETFMAQPLRCARCHDHKFDPIPTRDYYSIQAVFATTQFADREAPFLPTENLEYIDEEKALIQEWLEETNRDWEEIKDREEEAAKKWFEERGRKYLPKNVRAKLHESKKPPRYLGLTKQDLGHRKLLNKRMQTLRRELNRYEPIAFTVYSGSDRPVHSARPMKMPEDPFKEIPQTFILKGGSVYSPADSVTPGILSAIPNLGENILPKLPIGIEKRRLEFAHWLANENNPLFVRTIVNRVWQYHFGKGIVESSNNLGVNGSKPTHPELLDWLCIYFIENDWSIKKLHKLIMTSETYQQSASPLNAEKTKLLDPDNEFLSHFSPRRLEAEEIRDAMLSLSGELNTEMGGIPVRPEINMEVALQPRHIMGSIARAYQPSPTPERRNRRSIYAENFRGISDPFMTVLNKPGSDLSCERRSSSTISPQALTMFNGNDVYQRAIGMALKIAELEEDPEDQIKIAIQLAWNRKATRKEIKEGEDFIQQMLNYHQENKMPDREFPVKVKREMFEEMTGETFEYEESLDVFLNYQPDPSPSDQKAETLALADYCKVLLNSNEFLFIY